MSSGAEHRSSMLDNIKWLFVLALVVGGIWGYYYAPYEIDGLIRLAGLILVLGAALGLAVTTARGAEYFTLVREARTEFRKVIWPTINETNYTTVIVMVLVVIIAFILWALDMFLGWGTACALDGRECWPFW